MISDNINKEKQNAANYSLRNRNYREFYIRNLTSDIRLIIRAHNINTWPVIAAYCLYCKKKNLVPYLAEEENKNIDWNLFSDILAHANEEQLADVILEGNDDIFFSENTTPPYLVDLSCKLLNIEKGDTVADMGCGSGNFILGAAQKYPAEYFGYDTYEDYVKITNIKAYILQQRDKITKETKISAEVKNVFALQQELATPQGHKFKKIFSHYTFNLKRTEVSWSKEIEHLTTAVPSANWAFNYLICSMLDRGGKGIAVMANGSTFNYTEKKIRKYFLDNGYIEAVIALPAVNMRVPLSLVIFSDNYEQNKKGVYMYEVSEYQRGRRQNTLSEANINKIIAEYHNENCFVEMEKIANHNYDLYPATFFNNEAEFFTETIEFSKLTVGQEGILRAGALSAKELDDLRTEEKTNYFYLNSSDIRNGIIKDNLPNLKDIPEKNKKFIIPDNSLILTKNTILDTSYKIAYIENTNGRNILANGNLYIIRLDKEKVNPYFVKAFLESKKGMALLESISAGSVIRSISLVALNDMPFPVVPMEKQNEIANSYCNCVEKIKNKEKEINNLREELDKIRNSNLKL